MNGFTAALCLAVVLAAGVLVHRELAVYRHRATVAWHQVDDLLRRRHSLAFDMVLFMEQTGVWDQAVADDVLSAARLARESRDLATRARAEDALSAAILRGFHTLRRSLESPDDLAVYQRQWLAVEERVAFAKRYYNDVAVSYNTRLSRGRHSIVRRALRMRPRETFQYHARFTPGDPV